MLTVLSLKCFFIFFTSMLAVLSPIICSYGSTTFLSCIVLSLVSPFMLTCLHKINLMYFYQLCIQPCHTLLVTPISYPTSISKIYYFTLFSEKKKKKLLLLSKLTFSFLFSQAALNSCTHFCKYFFLCQQNRIICNQNCIKFLICIIYVCSPPLQHYQPLL